MQQESDIDQESDSDSTMPSLRACDSLSEEVVIDTMQQKSDSSDALHSLDSESESESDEVIQGYIAYVATLELTLELKLRASPPPPRSVGLLTNGGFFPKEMYLQVDNGSEN